MKALFSLVYREMVLFSRQRFFRTKRLLFLLITGCIFYQYIPQGVPRPLYGLKLFYIFTLISFFILMVIPLRATTSISREKKQKTLDVLLLTNLTPFSFISAKCFSHIFFTCVAYFSMLPLVIFCVNLGGISAPQIIVTFAIATSFFILITTVAIYSSTRYEKNEEKFFIVFLILYLGTGSFIGGVFFPFSAFKEAFRGASFFICYFHIALNLMGSFVVLSLAVNRLSKAMGFELEAVPSEESYQTTKQEAVPNEANYPTTKQEEKDPFPPASLQEKPENKPKTYKIKKHVKKEIKKNPILWLDYHKKYQGNNKHSCAIFLSFFFLGLFGGEVLLIMIIPATLMVATVVVYNYALRAFTAEKEQRTLDFILLTGLSDEEIVFSKLYVVVKILAPFLVMAVFFFIVQIVNGYITNVIQALMFLLFSLSCIANIAVVSLLASLWCKTYRKASMLSSSTVFLWLFALISLSTSTGPNNNNLVSLVFGIIINSFVCWLCIGHLINNLRHWSLRI